MVVNLVCLFRRAFKNESLVLFTICSMFCSDDKLREREAGLQQQPTFSNHIEVTKIKYEPRCEKTGIQSFRPGPTQTRLYNSIRWLEA